MTDIPKTRRPASATSGGELTTGAQDNADWRKYEEWKAEDPDNNVPQSEPAS